MQFSKLKFYSGYKICSLWLDITSKNIQISVYLVRTWIELDGVIANYIWLVITQCLITTKQPREREREVRESRKLKRGTVVVERHNIVLFLLMVIGPSSFSNILLKKYFSSFFYPLNNFNLNVSSLFLFN